MGDDDQDFSSNVDFLKFIFSALPIFPVVFVPELGAANVPRQDQETMQHILKALGGLEN